MFNNVSLVILKTFFHVGYDDELNTWEPESNLNCENLIRDYLSRRDSEEAQSILGVTIADPQKHSINLVVQNVTKQRCLIPLAQACQRFPLLVIDYFEKRLCWPSDNLLNSQQNLNEEEVRKMKEKTNNFHGGFDRKYIPEAIGGVINTVNGLLVLIKWKDHGIVELVPAKEVHKHCPELLLNYYIERLAFDN